MIPSYFVQMDKIPLSQSGKIDKKALPEPELKNNENYVAPRNEIEKKLVELWSEVLAKDTLLSPQLQTSIGIDDNFFQLGGHSLKAINIINKIQKSFGVTIELQTIFQHPTIAGISRIIRNSKVTGFEDIEKQPEKEYYDLSYSQKRLWYISKTEPDSPLFNMSGIVKLDETINEQVIRIVLGQLAARHESLRTCFKEKDKEPRQVIEPVDRLKINLEIMDISELSGPDKEKRRKEILMAESLYIFNLEQLPLFRVKLIKYAADEYNLVFNMHHIISDGWSIEILKQEFRQLVDAYKKGIEAPLEFLEPLGIQYKDYAVWQNRLLADEKQVGKAQEFWREQLSGGLPKLNLPYDFSTNYSADDKESAGYRWVIPGDLSGRLKLIAESRQASLFMLLLAGFNILMAQVSGQEKIIIAIPAAARQHEYLKNIIGLFLNTLILSSRVVGSEPFQVFFNRLQNNIFKVLEYQGIPLESICGQLKIKYPEVSVLFNMINTGTTEQQNLDNLASYHIEKIQDAKFEIVCYLTEYKNGIEINCHYYKNRFNPNIIEKLMERYLEILAHISDNPSRNIREYFFSGKQKKLKRGGDPCTLKIEKK
jgi:acyl carrier protein